MKNVTQQHPLEAKLTRTIEGYRHFPEPHIPLVFKEEKILPTEVIGRCQRGLDACAEVRRAAAELDLAIARRDRLIPPLRLLCAEARVVARRHFGSDAEKMAAFKAPRRGRAEVTRQPERCEVFEEVVTTVVEEVSRGGAVSRKRRRSARK